MCGTCVFLALDFVRGFFAGASLSLALFELVDLLEGGCACPQGGVEVGGREGGFWGLLWGLGSPVRDLF